MQWQRVSGDQQTLREQGEDYWIDPDALAKANAPPKPRKRKPPAEDQISKEKLRDELTKPYTENWGAAITLGVFALIAIGGLFPGLLEVPSIVQIPDL